MDATPGMTHADLQAFQRAPRERRSPNKRDARIEKLQTKLHELAEAVDAALDDEDEEADEEGERLGEQLQALEDGFGLCGQREMPLSPSTGDGQIQLLREAEAHCARWSGCGRGFGSEGEAANEDAGGTTSARPPPCLTDWRSG